MYTEFILISSSDISVSPHLQANMKGWSGVVNLDLELLKQFRVSGVATDTIERLGAPDIVWLEYSYRRQHPPATRCSVLNWEPHNKSLPHGSYKKVHYDPASDELVLKVKGKDNTYARVTQYQYLGDLLQVQQAYIARIQDSVSSVSELNLLLKDILHRLLMPDRNSCAVHTFRVLEWESEQCRGVMQAHCYPR